VRATSSFPDAAANQGAIDTPTAPFALEFVTITKQEHIQLKMAALQWQTLHRKAVAKCEQQEVRHNRIVRELKAQNLKSNAALQTKLDWALAQVRDLQKRLFSTKSEQTRPSESRSQAATCRKRGQQRGTIGHGRTIESQLSERHEDIFLEKAQCPECGLALKEFAGTEDAQVMEIEVKAYRRVIHRHRYWPTCECGCVSGIVTAPSPARLINRGKFGISVWSSVLLDKFAYGRPSQRLLQDLADHGLNMAPGTLAGGLQAIAPLFKPLDDALQSKLRSEPYWHADETRWAVFVEVLGKVGHRWYMWVFQSCSVVHYVVDQSRAAEVIIAELAGVDEGIISCDRYSGYKRFARLNPGGRWLFAGLIKDVTSWTWPTHIPRAQSGHYSGWTGLGTCTTSTLCA
jgi:transposase